MYAPFLTLNFLLISFFLTFIANAVLLFRRRHRKLSLVLCGLTCIAFPFGTAIGVASIFLLTRDEISSQYA